MGEECKVSLEREYEIKIYLKKVKKPHVLIVTKKSYFDEMYQHLANGDKLIKIGTFIFNGEDFYYATLEEI